METTLSQKKNFSAGGLYGLGWGPKSQPFDQVYLPWLAPFAGGMKFARQISPLLNYTKFCYSFLQSHQKYRTEELARKESHRWDHLKKENLFTCGSLVGEKDEVPLDESAWHVAIPDVIAVVDVVVITNSRVPSPRGLTSSANCGGAGGVSVSRLDWPGPVWEQWSMLA